VDVKLRFHLLLSCVVQNRPLAEAGSFHRDTRACIQASHPHTAIGETEGSEQLLACAALQPGDGTPEFFLEDLVASQDPAFPGHDLNTVHEEAKRAGLKRSRQDLPFPTGPPARL
jgi:hypothetical protein